jgi:hypothetical protein
VARETGSLSNRDRHYKQKTVLTAEPTGWRLEKS